MWQGNVNRGRGKKKMETSVEKVACGCALKSFACRHKKIIMGVGLLLFVGGLGYGFLKKRTVVEDDRVDEFVINHDFKDRTFGNLDVYGSASGERLTVHGPSNIYGKFDVKNSQLSDITIYGALRAENTQFRDVNAYGATRLKQCNFNNLEVYGSLQGHGIHITQDLMITGACFLQEATISFCQFMGQDIYVKNTSIKTLKLTHAEKKKITVHVQKSAIDKIIFDGAEGDVRVYDEQTNINAIEGGDLKHTKAKFTPKVQGE
ncbi:MAG: hypothetical protein NEHIOOID_00835 [Holosporales bacterium]